MITTTLRRAVAAIRSTKAVSAAEYAILAVGIVIVVAGAATAFGPQLQTAFTNIGSKITSSQNSAGSTGGTGGTGGT